MIDFFTKHEFEDFPFSEWLTIIPNTDEGIEDEDSMAVDNQTGAFCD